MYLCTVFLHKWNTQNVLKYNYRTRKQTINHIVWVSGSKELAASQPQPSFDTKHVNKLLVNFSGGLVKTLGPGGGIAEIVPI
jgi:hypothetical protein